jgi:hypothetical protein
LGERVLASFFASVASAVSVAVTACALVTFTGNTTHHNQPLVHKINPEDIAHRGPFLGARHTGSLGQASSTIFFKPNAATALGVLAMHVVESPMVLNQRILAAKALAANDPVVTAKVAVTTPDPAPSVQPAASPQPALVYRPAKQGVFT